MAKWRVTVFPALLVSMVTMPGALDAAEATGAPAGLPSDAAAAVAADEPRRVESVGPWAFKRIEWAHGALAAEQYDEVEEALAEMREHPRLNSHERAIMWQTYGYLYSSRDQYAEAAEAFEACLATQGLREQGEQQTRYNLAQLYVLLERHGDAIRQFDTWFAKARSPSGAAYYLHAMAYVQKSDKDKALELARMAVATSADPKEPWLQLIVAILLERKDYEAAIPVLEQLIARFEKKPYWLQLSAVYSAMDRPERALAVLELAQRQGRLDQGGDYLVLAQLYLYNQIPLKAAAVIEEGVERKLIAPDARSYQLLADSLLAARERERAIPSLRRAAELSASGNAYMRLAQLSLEREDWAAARVELAAAIDKGDLTSPGHAYLLLGIASANQQRWEEAEAAFGAAQSFDPVRGMAEHWLRHLASQRQLERHDAQVAGSPSAPHT